MPRCDRQEFTRDVRVQITCRATDELGNIRCEQCGCIVKRGQFAIDHIDADGMKTPEGKKRKLTAADGQLLCAGSADTCHGRKTGQEDQPAIARAKSIEATHLGVQTPTKHKIQSRGFDKKPKPDKLPIPKRREGYFGSYRIK